MSTAELLSIALGVISAVLGVISIYLGALSLSLAKRCRKLDQRLAGIEHEVSSGKLNSVYLYTRELSRAAPSKNAISLAKDRLLVTVTEQYRPSREAEVVEALQRECPPILKPCYIDHLCTLLVTEGPPEDAVELPLRKEYTPGDLAGLQRANKHLEPLGIHLDYMGSVARKPEENDGAAG